MADLQINKVNFRTDFESYVIYISVNPLPYFKQSKNNIKEEFLKEYIDEKSDDFYYSFEPHPEANEVFLDVKKNRYFLFPYIDYLLYSHLKSQAEKNKLVLKRNFVNGIEIWTTKESKETYVIFERYAIRIVDKAPNRPFSLLLSYEGESLIYKTCLEKVDSHIRQLMNKVVINREILYIEDISEQSYKNAYPVISREMKKNLNILENNNIYGQNQYKNYYTKIHQFYNQYLSGQFIAEKIYISNEGFVNVSKNQIRSIKFVNNSLEFKLGRDTNILNGLKLYGPYQPPKTSNVKFIFIYKESRRLEANSLYGYLTKGYANAFPNFKQFLRVEEFSIDVKNSIKLTSTNDIEELGTKINNFQKEEGIQYFAIYLFEHNKINSDQQNGEIYYQAKHLLIKNNILSQFIYYKNITSTSFRYHLPNIAIAIAAKLNGIPWRLDVKNKDSIVIGFGIKQNGKDKFLGNTLCFDDRGVFFSFDSFEEDTPSSLAIAFESSIQKIIKALAGKNKFNKIVIHYYKTLGKKEANIIENILKNFNLDIPYIVLTISETDSKDYVVFDSSSQIIMPVSGTVVEIKHGSDFLLINNERYNENSSLNIKKFPFPVRVKINSTNNSYLESFDVDELIEQIYSFSRIYWKSVSQISIPVTIKYSKIIADLSSHFPDNKLPNNQLAHSNLWFL